MSSLELKSENEELQKLVDNFKSDEYDEYLDNFKKTLEDRKKCLKSKKCAFKFTVNQSNIIKKKDDKVIYNISLPKYLMVDTRLLEIRHRLQELDKEIRYLQNVISLEGDKKIVEEYKIYRQEFLELEKEQKLLVDYLDKINEDQKRQERKVELTNKLKVLQKEKLVLYQQIVILNSQKTNPKFSETEYKKKIKEYLENKEIEMIKTELRNLETYFLKTDKLFFNTPRDETLGKINYMIEKMPGIKKKTTKKITKSIQKKSISKK